MTFGCRETRDDLDYSHNVLQYWPIASSNSELAQFEGVRFDGEITQTLQKLIREDAKAENEDVMIVGDAIGVYAFTVGDAIPKSIRVLVPDELSKSCVEYNLAAIDQEVDQVEVSATGLPTEGWEDGQLTFVIVDLTWIERDGVKDLVESLAKSVAVGSSICVVSPEKAQMENVMEIAAGVGLEAVKKIPESLEGIPDRPVGGIAVEFRRPL